MLLLAGPFNHSDEDFEANSKILLTLIQDTLAYKAATRGAGGHCSNQNASGALRRSESRTAFNARIEASDGDGRVGKLVCSISSAMARADQLAATETADFLIGAFRELKSSCAAELV